MKKFLFFAGLSLVSINQVILSQFDASSFGIRKDIGGMPYRPGSLEVADFTGDGLPELVAGGDWNRNITIFNNQSTKGNLVFNSGISFPTDYSDDLTSNGIFNNSMKIVDMNDDGLNDIVMSGYWNGGVINGAGPNQPGIINVYLNKGNTILPSFSSTADKSLLVNDYDDQNDGNSFIDVADINGDGKPDIAAKRTWSAGHTAYLNTSKNGVISFSAGIPLNGGKSSWKDGIRIIDMDEDGANDIIGLSETQIWLAKNNNNAFPASSVKYDVAAPKYMDIADIDNDGDNDILVVSANNIIVGVNDHSQTDLAAKFPQTFIDNAGTGNLSQLAKGDFDKDGLLDLAVTQSNGEAVAGNLILYKNTSTPNNISLIGFAGYEVLKDPGVVRVADFDGDGKLDIIVHHFLQGQDSITIFLNTLNIPGVSSLTPVGAGKGEQVIINGSGLTDATKVIFTGTSENEVLATDFIVDAEGKTITLNVPAGAKSGKIRIENLSGIYFQDAIFSLVRAVPVIDGVEDALWNTIPTEDITHMVTNYAVEYDVNDLSGSFKAYWNTDALYILGKVKDDILIPPALPAAGEWNNDYFEVYIDYDNAKNVLPDGSSYDVTSYDSNDSQIRFVYATDSVSGGGGFIPENQAARAQIDVKEITDIDNLGYIIEIRIPWTAMGENFIAPKAGMKIGFDIQLADNDGSGRDREMAWKTFSDNIYHNAALFGTLELMEDGTLLSHNDNEKPSDITGLTAGAIVNTVTLTWDSSTDNIGVTAYKVFDAAGKQILSTTETTATFSNLKFNTSYQYLVLALDAAYNQSNGAGVEVLTLADAESPTMPSNFKAIATGLSVKLSWTASADNDKVLNYKIYQDDVLIKTTVSLGLTVNLLANKTSYIFSIVATDPAGNVSTPATVQVNIATSVDQSDLQEFQIYPNPVTDKLIITNASSIALVKLFNANGQILITQNNESGSILEISTFILPKGMYLIKITSLQGEEFVKKIIKK